MREGGLAAKPLGALPGGCQQLPGVIDADRLQLQQPGCGAADQFGQPLVGQADLLVELVDPASDHAQRRFGGLDRIGQGGLVKAQPGAGGDQRRGGAALQRLPQ